MKNALNVSSCSSGMAEPRFYSHEGQHEACGEENFKVTSQCRTTSLTPAVQKGYMRLVCSESEPSTQALPKHQQKNSWSICKLEGSSTGHKPIVKRAETATVLALKMCRKKHLLMLGAQV